MAPLRLLLSLGLLWRGGAQDLGRNSPSSVLDLSDRFLEVKDSGHWFVEFYAPWCGHCKRLAPVWEQVAESLGDELPDIRVGKLDATRFPSVASELHVHGFPTLKYFRNGQEMEYHGDRTKRALIDFAKKAYGPEVRAIYPDPKYFHQRYLEHYAQNFFVLVKREGEDDGGGLGREFQAAAEARFTQSFFFSATKAALPTNVSVIPPLPAVLAVSAEGVVQFDSAAEEGQGDLLPWIDRHRHPLFPGQSFPARRRAECEVAAK